MIAFGLARFWRTPPDHYLDKPLSALRQDHIDTVAFLERTERQAEQG